MKALTPVGELNRAVSSTYRHAAGGVLEWKQEKAFFEAQIKKNWQIARAVNNNVTATIESLKLAVRECASMGLSMSPNAQLVYFIPRKARKQKAGESKEDYAKVPIIVTATPSYRGLAYIAMNYAGAQQIAAEVVYEADLIPPCKFEYRGPITEPLHKPTLDNTKRHEKAAIGVYAVVRMQDGTFRCEYVDAPTVQKIRQLSDFPNGMMWKKLWTEGWRKVPIRRICKTVMVTEPRMAVAVEAMNTVEGISFDEIPTTEAEARERISSGVAGLGEAMKQQVIEHDEPIDAEPTEAITLQDPKSCTHPPGSIEWWSIQVLAAETLARMDDIKVAALADGVDRSDDADSFRQIFAERSRTIRGAA